MYQALYRKYRPSTFDDVISQPHITTTLKNQIINGKTAHAYLFTGSRGTGKTTCARILAKALNCLDPKEGNPCGECEVCRDADNFALADIIEIDAASNGSVHDARELREAAEYTPERCRYKVYIIDEVHMLSKDAFNALLKVIEEPPPHIKFIMATTELHKVLPTILSRCQRFDFMRIRTEDISARLRHVAECENIAIDDEAAMLIAKAADGGMRDALSILDRCIAFSDNITSDVVSEAAGIAGREYLFSLVQAIADKDAAGALDIISQLYDRSKDMQRLCEELTTQLRNIMIAISAPDRTNVIVCLPSELETIKKIAAKMPLETVLRHLDTLGKCAERMTRSLSKRIDMEMCIIRMCSGIPENAVQSVQVNSAQPAPDKTVERLTARIAALEEQLQNGAAAAKKPSASQSAPVHSSRAQLTDTSAINNAGLVYIEKWLQVCDRVREVCPPLAPVLAGTHGYSAQNMLLINSKNNLLKVLLCSDENKSRVLEAVKEITGQSYISIKVGYRPTLERSSSGSDDASQQDDPLPEGDKMDDLLKKAADGGVTIESL